MFEQCEPAWLLTGSDLAERAGALCTKADRKTQVVCFPSEDTIGSEEQSVPLVDRDPDDFCYVYFTSGSSGKPKGIAGRLRAIDHFIRWEIKTLELGPGTRVSQLINPSFDAFLRDIFVPLCSVGTISSTVRHWQPGYPNSGSIWSTVCPQSCEVCYPG
jgi:non-ribosomal peptide synthetase component F